MSSIDLTTALGRLLSDGVLRHRFTTNPRQVAQELSLRPSDVSTFLALDRGEIERQARSLLEKRRHETAKLLPQTFAWLDADPGDLFIEYARCHWPSCHARYLEDAVEFGHFLLARRHAALDRIEFNRVRFLHERRRLRVHWLSHAMTDGRPRCTLQILLRFRRATASQLLTYLAH